MIAEWIRRIVIVSPDCDKGVVLTHPIVHMFLLLESESVDYSQSQKCRKKEKDKLKITSL